MSKRDEQIARMKGLMTYGISNTSKKTPVSESVEGADGKIYAIIREGAKFYIKSAKKGRELVTESFDYIGGFMNKKNNEFSSYNQASKNLELKLRSMNEAYGINKPVELLNPDKKEELVCEMTDTMKASIARYRQIMNNAAGIMNESKTISASNTGNPEAPKTTSFSPKLGEPFNNTAEAKLDTDLKSTANNPEKQGEPFGDNSKAEEYKDAQYVPDGSVANKKPSGGKVVKVNENEEFEETIEECEEWGSCGLPSSEGVGEVGDDAPFTEATNCTIEENNFFHNDAVSDDEQLSAVPDEVNINEDSESFVGFSDDDTIDEGNDEEDIDLDDIDLDLDSDDMEDEELDDVDTDETLDDEGELDDVDTDETLDNEEELDDELESNDDEEMDEISMLRNEVDELRKLVNELIGDKNSENEDDFEDEDDFEVDFDDEDDDFEDDEDDDLEQIHEGRKPKEAYKPSVDLPFEVNPQYVELKNKKPGYVYSLGVYLEGLLQKFNGNERDFKIVEVIKQNLRTVLECNTELRACIKNEYKDIEAWETIVDSMLESVGNINSLLRKLSFHEEIKMDKNVQGISNSLVTTVDRYLDALEEMKGESTGEESYDEYDDNLDDVEQNDSEYYSNDNDEDIDFDDLDDLYSTDNEMFDSVKPRRIFENGTKLNVFGKHPGYRKKVMSLPQTGSDRNGDYRDWNDESVYSEQPFGEKIGVSTPFDKLINSTVETVMESLKKKI